MRTIFVICVILISQGLYHIGGQGGVFEDATKQMMAYVLLVSFVLDIVRPVIKIGRD